MLGWLSLCLPGGKARYCHWIGLIPCIWSEWQNIYIFIFYPVWDASLSILVCINSWVCVCLYSESWSVICLLWSCGNSMHMICASSMHMLVATQCTGSYCLWIWLLIVFWCCEVIKKAKFHIFDLLELVWLIMDIADLEFCLCLAKLIITGGRLLLVAMYIIYIYICIYIYMYNCL